MKSMMKKGFSIICIISIMILGVGCASKDVEKSEEVKTEKGYSQELTKYFPAVEGMVFNYSGVAEYGQTLTLNKVIEENEKITLNFKGEIEDMSEGEGPSKEDRILETQYVINEDDVKEIQKNKTRRFSQSIIREQVVLKLPIEEGASWNQQVNIDGKEYTAETKITDVSTDPENKSMVTTEIIIKGMKGYPEDTYKEVKTFKEGKGLIAFEYIMLLEGEEETTPFPFNYSLFERE
ncbi:hypothetical protein [Crassaminicella profunda]|uniref:hypothetical protein n=1 Tax=Crassaminicella profunda TaxID=1286698 RepID=UPI001CA7728D|nr:hypothetical protein [Crassaminicella profunda]QZY55187.1 hypothetical protein K7H06_19645 [Crassaminicella profunda]